MFTTGFSCLNQINWGLGEYLNDFSVFNEQFSEYTLTVIPLESVRAETLMR